MLKGRKIKENKRLSIVLVSENNGKSKPISFSISHKSLITVISIILLVSISITVFAINEKIQNSDLKLKSNDLMNVNSENYKQSKNLSDELNAIKAEQAKKDEAAKKKAEEDKKKTDAIVAQVNTVLNNMKKNGTLTSRSDRSSSTSAERLIKILKEIQADNQTSKNINSIIKDTQSAIAAEKRSVPTYWPIKGSISSSFGYRVHPVYGYWKFHDGVDIEASYGQTIRAAADGTVIFSGWDGAYGQVVKVRHINGLTTFYGHCSKLLVGVGKQIKQGDIVAEVGSTGVTTGPHLHFTVLKDGVAVDPMNYLK
jgi:murein DD-endopeptidase MepM/ murein hydrolase activator NlpD